MQILALWLWLERVGFCNLVNKILSLPNILINEAADEAIKCLNCINNTLTSSSSELSNNIPLLRRLMEEETCLSFLYENRAYAIQGVAKMVERVCIRAFTDIMHKVMMIRINSIEECNVQNLRAGNEVAADDRTLFVTFSKGYPVVEWEVREFVRRRFGDCIEGLYMQEVKPNDQALFARVVFHAPSTIDLILKGATRAKFTINGKHVWARKFVPKRATTLLPM